VPGRGSELLLQNNYYLLPVIRAFWCSRMLRDVAGPRLCLLRFGRPLFVALSFLRGMLGSHRIVPTKAAVSGYFRVDPSRVF
jgi:hypothetical protein